MSDDVQTENPQMPTASFAAHVYSIGVQALIFLGKQPHPETGEYTRNLEIAKFQIDTLAILQEKTEGHRTEEESKILDDLLHATRMAYLDETQQKSEG